jgi:glycosyltransferase involved in cell wall biosynthesis
MSSTVLLLTASRSDLQTRRLVACLRDRLGEPWRPVVRTIGRGGDWRSAVAAARGLRRGGEWNVVHAWGLEALWAAALAARCPILWTPVGAVGRSDCRWLRAIRAYRPVECVAASGAQARELARGGVPVEAIRIVRPGVDLARCGRRPDAALRRALGLAADDYVLLAAGESTAESGHRVAVWAASILHHLDRRHRMVLWGRGPVADSIRQFAQAVGGANVLRVATEILGAQVEWEDLLPVADMIVAPATGTVPPLPLICAMAAGLPVVGAATPAVSEVLEDRHTALLAPPDDPRALAQRILVLREDAGLQWRLADRARAEAYEYFAPSRYLQEMRAEYGRAGARPTG